MSTQDQSAPLTAVAIERPHPAYAKLAQACITLARQQLKPPEGEVKHTPDGAAK